MYLPTYPSNKDFLTPNYDTVSSSLFLVLAFSDLIVI